MNERSRLTWEVNVFCEWFALCDNEAVGTTPHPTLGDVPICQRCADKLDLPITPFATKG